MKNFKSRSKVVLEELQRDMITSQPIKVIETMDEEKATPSTQKVTVRRCTERVIRPHLPRKRVKGGETNVAVIYLNDDDPSSYTSSMKISDKEK